MNELHGSIFFPKFQGKYSAKTDAGDMLREEALVHDKKSLKNRMIVCFMTFLLNCLAICRYTESNTAATPLNNAQPWRLFLSLNSERPHG